MKTLKDFLEDMISTANFQPSNLVGSRRPDGSTATPSLGPQKANGPKLKLKKKAKINSGLGIQKRPTPYKIQPAEWDVQAGSGPWGTPVK